MARESFPARQPDSFAALCLVVLFAGNFVGGIVGSLVPLAETGEPLAELVEKLGARVGACAALLLLLVLFRCWRMAGFTPRHEWRRLHLSLVPAAMILINLAWHEGPHEFEPVRVLLHGSAMLLTGFSEEVAFRGLILGSLASSADPLAPRRAVVVSSFLFSAVHSVNLISQPTADVLAQIAYSFAIGLSFAALRLRTGTIWPAILIHGIYNVVSSTYPGPMLLEGVWLAGVSLFFVLLGVWGWWQARFLWADPGARAQLPG